MLNKKCCLECWARRAKHPKAEEVFNQMWGYGHVMCNGFRGISITKQPPKFCPYILEHLMEEQGHVE